MAFDEELLYTVSETSRVRFTGIETEAARYDFGFVYTQQFRGKVLVVCMQTGQSALLDLHALGIKLNDTEHISEFLRLCLVEKTQVSEKIDT